MALTRDFKEGVQARVQRDPALRKALLCEAAECILTGEWETGKALLRDYINATISFGELGELTHKSPKSLMRMLGPSGNPQAENIFEILVHLQEKERIRFKVAQATVSREVKIKRATSKKPVPSQYTHLH